MLSFPSDTTARIERRGSPGGALVESMLPMQAMTPTGRRVPVDLRLKDHGRWLQPIAPLVDVRLPKRARVGVRLKGSGVGFGPRVETDAAARVIADKTFYSGIHTDTDYVLQPAPTGVESFYQLRSQRSPKRLTVDIRLPRGARLRHGEDPIKRLEVVRGELGREQVLGSFAPPVAWDADRRSVVVGWRLAGNALRLDVAHRGRDLKYPIMVDPQWTEDQRYWHRGDLPPGGIKDRNGWAYEETDTNGNFVHDEPQGADAGLYLWAGPAAIRGQWAHWVFRAPPETWIFRFETYTSHTTADNGTTVFIGVYGGAGAPGWNPVNLYGWDATYYGPAEVFAANWNWSYFYLTECLGNNPCSPYHTYGNPAGYYGNAAIFQLNKDSGAWFNSAWLGGAQVAMEDDTAPTVSVNEDAPDGWVEDATVTATGSASDRGFGVQSFELWRHGPGGGVLSALPGQPQCSNTERPVHCPANDSETFVYSTAGMPQGVNTYGIRARDFVNNWSAFSNWDVKLDRSPPEALGLSRPASGGWVREAPTLITDANDRHSGVRSTEIEVTAAADSFGRTTVGGWGRADTGGVWTREAGLEDDFSTDGSAGRIALPPDEGVRSQSLETPRHMDVDVTTRVKFAQPVSGADRSSTATLKLRRQPDDAGSSYRVSLSGTGDGRLLVSARAGDQTQVFPTADTSLGFTAGAWYRVRTQLDSSLLRVKVWRDGTSEPPNWQWSGTTNDNGPYAAGGIGLEASGNSTSLQEVFFDDLKLTDLASNKVAYNPNDAQPCGTSGCPTNHRPGFAWESSGFTEGAHDITLRATDPLGHTTTAAATVRLDRTPPVITARRGSLAEDGATIGRGQQTLSLDASDSPSGVTRIEATVDDADNPSDTPVSIGTKTCATGGCPTLTGDFTWDSTNAPARVRLIARAIDQAGNEDVDEWTVRYGVDQRDPVLELTGDMRPPIATGRSVHIKARDDQPDDSGVQKILVWLDPDSTPTDDEATHVHAPGCVPKCPAAAETDWALLADTAEGEHRILIRARDAAKREDTEDYKVNVVALLPSSRSKLGLEHWFDYDDTDAGGGTKVYVNGETGNTVWHGVPIVNPGRGLSTVVNLTYNSHDRGGVLGSTLGRVPLVDLSGAELSNDLPGLSYGEAGVGFSLGISGPTRLNEPLGGLLIAQMVEEGSTGAVPGYTGALPAQSDLVVTMTDSDGTVHAFTKGASGDWIAPPGVNMRLRRFRNGGTLVNPIDDKWALTRPDGVTHFFDNLGYLTKTKDRNGNVLEYVYEAYDALTGNVTKSVVNSSGQTVDYALCDGVQLGKNTQVTLPGGTQVPVFCAKRVARVKDPAGRELKIEYNDYDSSYLGLADGQLPVEFRADFPGLIGGRAGRIKKITDHAQREYTFEYDDYGYLTKFVEAANMTEKRTTELEYEAWEPGLAQIGQDRQLAAVKEAETGRKTAIRHVHPDDRHGPPSFTVSAAPRQACGVTKRNNDANPLASSSVSGQECRTRVNDLEKTYDYTVAEETQPRTFEVDEILMRAQAGGESASVGSTLHEIDDRGRPTAIVDPLARRTELTWSDDENAVTSIEEAAGTPDAALTEISYDQANHTGAITEKRTYPDYKGRDNKGSARTTGFSYQFSSGVHRSSASGVSDLSSFVADLTEIRKPKSGTGASFEIKQDAAGNYLGLVTKSYDKPGRAGNPTTTVYDPSGQITEEYDELHNKTTYAQHHATGQPQRVTDPDGKLWNYKYDDVGNVRSVIDPRAPAPRSGGANDPYTTTLVYDAFDRLTNETIPKLSTGSDPAERFRTKSRTYDRNGNVRTAVDGEGKPTAIDYTPMDQPRLVTAPGRPNRPEVTDYVYDDADRLIARVDPKGTRATPAVGRDSAAVCVEGASIPAVSHVTRYCLDAVGRRVAEIRSSSLADLAPEDSPTALITSYAFDRRDNEVGVVDPMGNSGRRARAAIDAAQVADPTTTSRRTSRTFNKIDELLDELEHPDETDAQSSRMPALRTRHSYDANGMETSVLPPRAFEGRPETEPDASFAQRTFYNDRGEVVAKRTPAGCTAIARRADGKVSAMTTPRGTAGVSVTAHDGDCSQAGPFTYHTTKYGYDNRGNVTSRSIPFAKDQYGRADSEFANWKVTYGRDDVGNPTTVTDPRDNSFTNEFYDSGELRSTERPSWYELEWGDDYEMPNPGRKFGDDGSDTDFELADGGPRLTEAEGRSRNAARSADEPELPENDETGNFGKVEREDLGDLLPDAGTTKFAYDGEMRLKTITDAADNGRGITYDDAGRVLTKTWPFKAGSPITHTFEYDPNGNLETYNDGRSASTLTRYRNDGYDRRTEEKTPGAASGPGAEFPSETSSYGYDANGNLKSRRTPRREAFLFDYDTVDRVRSEKNPAGEQWAYGYDAGGNVAFERSPRWHAASTAEQGKLETAFTYDTSDRLTKVHRGLGDQFNVEYGYDAEGNQTKVTSPGSASLATGSPARREQTTDYDGRGLPWRESTATAGGGDKRTTLKEFDPNGNLRRIVNPIGVTASGLPKVAHNPGTSLADATWHATVREYDHDDQLTEVWLPWSKSGSPTVNDPNGPGDAEAGGDERRFVQTFDRSADDNPLKRVKFNFSPHQTGDAKVPRTRYTYLANGWVRTISDEKLARPNDTDPAATVLMTFNYDKIGNQTSWKTKNAGDSTKGREIKRQFYPDGSLQRRVAYKPQPAGDGDCEESDTDCESLRKYNYYYNANRSLTRIDDFDSSPTAPDNAEPDRTTRIGRDDAERQTFVDESTTGTDTYFHYDPNGNVEKRETDGEYNPSVSTAGLIGGERKVSTFEYDPLDRETKLTVDPAGDTDPNRITQTTWWDSGDMRARTKKNGTLESYFYNPRGEMTLKTRDPVQGDTQTQEYAYDRDGNRTKDERGDHRFNPRGQLVHWTRGPKYANSDPLKDKDGTVVTYERNGSGDIEKKTDTSNPTGLPGGGNAAPVTTTFRYYGERLVFAQTAQPLPLGLGEQKTRSTYSYDDFGSVIRIAVERLGPGPDPADPPDGPPPPAPCEEMPDEATAQATRYCFDEFERMINSRGEGITAPKATYRYDALDRRDVRTETDPSKPPETYGYSYVGTSRLLSREKATDGKTKTYDYDSDGRRLGQAVKTATDTTPTFRTYANDASGSVEGLEDDSGGFGGNGADTYLYDPYGESENASDQKPDSGLSDVAKDNPFRFQGFYFDSGVKAYDMQARQYRPDVGRFLSQDRYESGAGDQLLQSDPLTQNRYAFAGGNPVNNVEFDGHHILDGVFNWLKQKWHTARRYVGRVASSVSRILRGAGRSGSRRPAVRPPAFARPPSHWTSFQLWPGERALARALVQNQAEEDKQAKEAAAQLKHWQGGGFLDTVHSALDVGGLIPGLGEPADFVNGIVYSIEGDKTNAGLSFFGAVPIAGWGATGTKVVRRLEGAGERARNTGQVVVRNPISHHARIRMAQHGITDRQVHTALRKGSRYYDRMHNTISHVLPGFASGHSLVVATNPLTGRVVTVMAPRRFSRLAPYEDGALRYVPLP